MNDLIGSLFHASKNMKVFRRLCTAVVAVGLSACYAAEPLPPIDVVESHVSEDRTGTRLSEVKVNINSRKGAMSAALKSELALLNTSKGMANPKIYSNSAHTIIGFNASPGRASYNINVIWLVDGSGYFVDQNLNTRLATLLKVNGFTKPFNEDGLYLTGIREQTLYLAFRSDDGREFFSFAASVSGDGELHLVPNSINVSPSLIGDIR